jgi:hypothetical protein
MNYSKLVFAVAASTTIVIAVNIIVFNHLWEPV